MEYTYVKSDHSSMPMSSENPECNEQLGCIFTCNDKFPGKTSIVLITRKSSKCIITVFLNNDHNRRTNAISFIIN